MLGCRPQRIIEKSATFDDPKSSSEDPGASTAFLKVAEGASHNFGNVNTFATEDVTLTLYNSGIKDADNIAVSTALAAPFSFSGGAYPGAGGSCGGSLNAETTCDIVLSYSPVAGGTFSSSFVLDYESEGDPLEFSFGVYGSSGSASVTTDEDPLLTFDNTLIGDVANVTVTLTNGGALSAKFITDAGSLSAPFSYLGGVYPGTGGTCAVTLTAGASCTFILSYRPTIVGTQMGAWGVGFLTGGNAGGASLILNGVSGIAVLEITDFPSYTYAATFIGDTADRTFTISNTGNFEASDVTDAFALSAPFSFMGGTYPGTGGTCTHAIDAGDDCTIVVRFEPTDPETSADRIELDYFDGENNQTLDLAVGGLGRGAILELTTGTNYNFGRLAKGTTEERTVTIQNIGNFSATSMDDALAPANPFYFRGFAYPGTGGSCGSVLSAGASCTVVLQYSPTGTGTALNSHTDTVEIDYSDGTNVQTLEVTLEGEAGLGSISVGSTAWGSRVVGTTTNRTVTITNNGTFAVTNIVEAEGPNSPFFWQTSGVYPGTGGNCAGATLAPGGNCNIRMSFIPVGPGAASDTIDLEYFDGNVTQLSTRTLTGTGIIADLDFSVALIDFGQVSYNSAMPTSIVTITNNGTYQATGVSVTGLAAPFTVQSNTCGVQINAGVTCNITVRFTPTAVGAVNDTLSINYSDGQALQQHDVTIDGEGINVAPVASAAAPSIPQDDPGTAIVLPATDQNGNAMTYSIVGVPGNGTLGVVVGNTVTYTPDPLYNGPDSFTFRAHDGMTFGNTATVSITVTP